MNASSTSADSPGQRSLSWRDTLLLVTFCLLLFGYSLVGGRPLTLHEAILPQTSREMLADHDWMIPKMGARPWIERPPLPQWICVAFATLVQQDNAVWVYRLPSAVLGTLIVALSAGAMAVLFGRSMGLMSGLILATMFEFCSYSWLAEQDIYLAAIVTAAMALFVRIEFAIPHAPNPTVFGGRQWSTIAFFLFLSMTNLVKGLLFGTAMVAIPVAGYLLTCGNWRRLREYLWFWGILFYLAVSIAWPIACMNRLPDALELWTFDLVGRLNGTYTAINEPAWYYLLMMTWVVAPWTPFVLLALALTARSAFRDRQNPWRFVWCWSVLPLAVFSLASGKHHHYLLHFLAPWSILAAAGVRWTWSNMISWRCPRPVSRILIGTLVTAGVAVVVWLRNDMGGPVVLPAFFAAYWIAAVFLMDRAIRGQHDRLAIGTVLAGIVLAYGWIFSCVLPHRDQCVEDTRFLAAVSERLKDDPAALIVNGDVNSMDPSRILFYLGRRAIPAPNLTFLRDKSLRGDSAYVVTRRRDLAKLQTLGSVDIVLESQRTRRETSIDDRYVLFRVNFDPAQPDYGAPPAVSAMQAMNRADGPFLGPRL